MVQANIKAVKDILKKHNLDAVAFVPGANFRRITGMNFHLMERPLVIIVQENGEAAAIVPNLEMDLFEKMNFPGSVFNWRDEEGYDKAFADAAASMPQIANSSRFGLEGQRMRVFEQQALAHAFPHAKFVDAHHQLSTVRLHKTVEELKLIRKAIEISETALEETLQTVEIGQTEAQVQSMLLNRLFANGADSLAFSPIVAAGANAALPHAKARDDYQIKHEDVLLIDFGAGFNGYNADITRSFFVGGVSQRDRKFYETVLSANEAGKNATRPGMTAHAIDDAVQTVLENSEFGDFILHKTGHGLGLDVHEAPQIMRGNDEVLEPGMVFTIEPGLYRQGECGVRIEDDVLVTEDGLDCLTSFPRDLRIIAG